MNEGWEMLDWDGEFFGWVWSDGGEEKEVDNVVGGFWDMGIGEFVVN